MPYKIRSPVLSAPWFEKIVADTINMYLRGEDLKNSPLSKMGRRLAGSNRWHWTLFNLDEDNLEDQLRVREKALIELFNSIKENGYNGSILSVWFDKDGRIHLYDGYHRLAVMKYLGVETEVNVETIWWNNDFDFPLANTLMELPRVGKCTYQPVNDERVKDFIIDRQDSPERLDYILNNLIGNTVLDIGCSEGYFSMEIAKRGYLVTAVDTNPGKVAVTRYLSTINNIDIRCECCDGEEFLKKSNGFDNVLYLSVFHNNIHDFGTSKAFLSLRKLRGKARRVFFEVPDGSGEQQWEKISANAPLFHFQGKDFEKVIKDATGMRILELNKGFRLMYLLEDDGKRNKAPLFRVISEDEWLKHNQWEKNWWKERNNAANTYGEQVLQEMYAKYMKLDQYASKRRSYTFDLNGKSVIDIGGGPVSLLLRCENFKRAVVVDPCDFPKWVADRYSLANIEYSKQPAENISFNKEFDEAWMYNVLQHVRDPVLVIKNAIASAKKVRVFEPLEIGIHLGHPHNLFKDALDDAFGREGLILDFGGKPGEVCYFGVFSYE